MDTPGPRSRLATTIAASFGGYALAGGLATLLGWAFNVRRLTDWENSGVSQLPNNALGVAAAAAAIVFWIFGWRRVPAALGAFAALIGAATLFEHLTSTDLGIDTLLLFQSWGQRGTVSPGRMGPPGATALTLIGVSIVLVSFPRTRRFTPAGGLITIAIGLLSLIGYLFGAGRLYTIPKLTTIAFQTSTMVLALGIALVASLPDRQPMKLFLGDSAAALLVRRALPGIILVPVVLGWASVRGQQLELFDSAFGTATLVLLLIAVLTALLWWSANAVQAHESQLEASERKFALLFEKANVGAVLASLPDGVIADANEAFVQQLGYTKPELIGRTTAGLGMTVDPRFREDEHGFVRGIELSLRTKSGEPRVFLHSAIVIELAGRQHALTTIQDITDRKRAEESLRSSAEALREADRMKDQFLATLSHELRTPLTSIVGWAHMLLDGTIDPPDQRAAFEAIRSSAKTQAQLI